MHRIQVGERPLTRNLAKEKQKRRHLNRHYACYKDEQSVAAVSFYKAEVAILNFMKVNCGVIGLSSDGMKLD